MRNYQNNQTSKAKTAQLEENKLYTLLTLGSIPVFLMAIFLSQL